MAREQRPRLAHSDYDTEYQYIDRKAEQTKSNSTMKLTNRKLSPKAMFALMNAVEDILSTEESMYFSEETKTALEHLMPDSEGIDEMFTFMYRSNQEEASIRMKYKDKNGKNPNSKWLKKQRLYYLPRVVENDD